MLAKGIWRERAVPRGISLSCGKNAFFSRPFIKTNLYGYLLVGFQQSKTNYSLFIYHRGSHIAYLLHYVDEIMLTTSSSAFLQRVIALLHSEFAMTELGSLNYFLGIYAQRSSAGADGDPVSDLILYQRLVSALSYNGLLLRYTVTLSRFIVVAEYRGNANVVAETTWVHDLLRELHAPLFSTTI
ncbi:ribonuclease H-like domain-containing protein, partial [Tanacetum coccineum]